MISDAQNQEVRSHPLREYLSDFTIQTCNQVQNFHSGKTSAKYHTYFYSLFI